MLVRLGMLSMFHKQANSFIFLLLVALQTILSLTSAIVVAPSSQAGLLSKYIQYLPYIIT